MRIAFSCDACGARGQADASAAGKTARCKKCGHRFTIPTPDEAPSGEASSEADEGLYALADPVAEAAPKPKRREPPASGEDGESTFTATYNEPKLSERRPGRRRAAESASPRRKRPEETLNVRPWLIRGGIGAAVVLGGIAMLAPHGVWIVGAILTVVGGLLVFGGYAVGTYIAFTEDFVHGFFFLTFPIYAAYYMVRNWDEMWPWFAASTVGVVLTFGGQIILASAPPAPAGAGAEAEPAGIKEL